MFSYGVKAPSGSPCTALRSRTDSSALSCAYLMLHALVLNVTFQPFIIISKLIRDLLTDSFYRSTWQPMQKRGGSIRLPTFDALPFCRASRLLFLHIPIPIHHTTRYRLRKSGSY
jgi:hypothetical protein